MAHMLSISVILVGVFLVVRADIIRVQNCSGIVNKVTDLQVDVSDCGGNNCMLYKGTTYYLKATFTPNEGAPEVNVRTLAVMKILKVSNMHEHHSVCPEATTEDGENCNPQVGFLPNKTYTHVTDFHVRRIYPAMNMKARVEYFTGMRSTRRNMLLCYEVPIKIENPPEDDNEIEEN